MLALVLYSAFRNAGDLNIVPLLCDLAGKNRMSMAIGVTNMLNTVAGGAGILATGFLKSSVGLATLFAQCSRYFCLLMRCFYLPAISGSSGRTWARLRCSHEAAQASRCGRCRRGMDRSCHGEGVSDSHRHVGFWFWNAGGRKRRPAIRKPWMNSITLFVFGRCRTSRRKPSRIVIPREIVPRQFGNTARFFPAPAWADRGSTGAACASVTRPICSLSQLPCDNGSSRGSASASRRSRLDRHI